MSNRIKSLFVDSRDANQSTSTSQFTIQLANSIPVRSIELKEVSLATLPYTVCPRLGNDTLTFSEDGGTTWLTCTLPPGYYTQNTLCSHLNNSMQNASNTSQRYASSVDDTTHQTTINNISAGNIKVKAQSLGLTLGFLSDSTSASTIVSDSQNKIGDPDYMFLNIDVLPQVNETANKTPKSFTFALGNALGTQTRIDNRNGLLEQNIQCTQDFKLQKFNVSLVDRQGNIIDMGALNWYFRLDLHLCGCY